MRIFIQDTKNERFRFSLLLHDNILCNELVSKRKYRLTKRFIKILVEMRGFEPLTSYMRSMRSPN